MSVMTIRFWGTRGSIPTPGRKTEKYGGNTTCLEIRHEDTIIVCDAGSGIRAMSEAWTREFAGHPIRAALVFTHLHWDHIQGFPFFSVAYQPDNYIAIYGEDRPSGGIRELLSGQMQGDYFPIPLSAMQADLDFQTTREEFMLSEVRVTSFRLPHPGGALGYRFEVENSVFVLATDCELDQVALNADEVAANPRVRRQYKPDLLKQLKGASLLVIDCQYTDEDYPSHRGWGHNSLFTVIDLCEQVRPNMVGLFHHDPQRTDRAVSEMVKDADRLLKEKNMRDVLVFAAREGLTMRVEAPLKPPAFEAGSG